MPALARDEEHAAGGGLSAAQAERFQRDVLPHLDAAYNLARHLVRAPEQAEDAVQEACLRALDHFDGFRGGDGRAWLLAIVRNTCYSLLRARQRREGRTDEFDDELHSPETDAGPEADRARERAGESLREALARLSLEFREVLVLRELEGLSYREIAAVAGVPIGTVMSRLSRARRQLAAALEPAEKEVGG